MPLTVLPTSEMKILDPRKSKTMAYLLDTSRVEEDLARNVPFYEALNRYCAEIKEI